MSIWSDERVALLRALWAEGLSAAQIAARLGEVSRNAVIGKAHRLRLGARATPARAVRPAPRHRARKALMRAAQYPRPAATDPIRSLIADLDPRRFDGGSVATVLSVTDRMCKYPIGDPSDPAFAFCGRDACHGPYCYDHARLVYQPQRAR